ncbi:MAG: SPOR domain-containing protein [Treponema sp.]|nr:SPOR domain-containing protein [Treponema sp.]
MEKKKLLLVAVSVGVVLLILIGIPLLLLTPKHSAEPLSEPLVWEPPAPVVPAPFEEPAAEVSENVPEPQPLGGGEQISEAIPQKPVEIPVKTTITVPTPRTVAVPDAPVRPAPRPSVAPAQPRPAAQAPKETKPQTPARPVQTASAYDNYWVQTGAFSTKIRAEGAKDSLEAKGITSIIDNSDINGKTWYRVRVGPYTSENEASYWLALVKSIDGFGESQIRQTRSR